VLATGVLEGSIRFLQAFSPEEKMKLIAQAPHSLSEKRLAPRGLKPNGRR
jgi:hypothetical protein